MNYFSKRFRAGKDRAYECTLGFERESRPSHPHALHFTESTCAQVEETARYIAVGMIVLTLSLFSWNADAQTVKTSVAAGDWNTASNWNPSGVPSGNNIIVVNHAMTRSAALTLSAWNSAPGNPTITINTGGSLTVTGNLTLEGQKMDFTLNGGSLTVTGTTTVQYGSAEMKITDGLFTADHLYVNSSDVVVGTSGTVNLNSLLTGNNSDTNYENNGTTTITGDINLQGALNNYGSLSAQGLIGNGSGSSNLNNYGTLDFSGSISVPSSTKFYLFPGSTCIVDGDFTSNANENLVIGTTQDPSVSGHADMIIKGNLYATGSGDVRVRQNGRLAIYGSAIADTHGGAFFSIDNGGRVFISEDIYYPGGGDGIVNNNSGGNIGLYVDGTVYVDEANGGSVGDPETTGGYADSDYLLNVEGGGDDEFYDWIEAAEDSPLPVVLLSFKAVTEGGKNFLQWNTASEKDNDFFTIEKSYDGRQFQVLDQIKGAGTSKDQHAYEWSETSGEGLVYYRLSQTDFDGSTELLGLKALNVDLTMSDLTIYPNPAVSGGEINIEGIMPERITIMDLYGRQVYETTPTGSKVILSGDFKPGTYFLRIAAGNKQVTRRIYISE